MADEIKLQSKTGTLTLLTAFATGALSLAGIEQLTQAATTSKLESFSCYITAGCSATYGIFQDGKRVGEKDVYFGYDVLTGKKQLRGLDETKLPEELKTILKAVKDGKLDALANE